MLESKITPEQFNKLLRMATDKYSLNPKSTYVEITWWDNVFKPLMTTDLSGENDFILVFGEDNCNTFQHISTATIYPCGFYIWSGAVRKKDVVHNPLTLNSLLDDKEMMSTKEVKFLFSNSPVNYFVDINPFRTRVYKNHENEMIFALYVDDRDSGEVQPFRDLKDSNIKFLDYYGR